MGFRVQGVGFEVQGMGVRIQGTLVTSPHPAKWSFRVCSLGVQGLGWRKNKGSAAQKTSGKRKKKHAHALATRLPLAVFSPG